MSREIKFKAVFTLEGETFVSDDAFTLEELASYEEHEWRFQDGGMTLPSNDVEPGSLEYIQWTGLHDKNGKEIYEGDIVESEGKNFEVKYEVDLGTLYYGPYFLKKDSEVRIIGNIHANPDLL